MSNQAHLPTFYVLFLLYIEPLSALVGALFALVDPALYLHLTHAPSLPLLIPTSSFFTSALTAFLRHLTSAPVDHAFSTFTAGLPPGASAPSQLDPAITAAVRQLGNLYLLFAVNEGLVLRAVYPLRTTRDLRVWRALLLGLLIADIGHLWSVVGTGVEDTKGMWGVYTGVMGWNAMGWGNVGFVYLGAATRVAFLMGVGLAGLEGRLGSREKMEGKKG